MPKAIPPLQENKKPFHKRNGSGELHAYESARFFESSHTTLAHKNYMREGGGRLSLDIPNTRRHSIPLQAMLMENRNPIDPLTDQNPMMIKNDKKYKQPSSPGGKLAHFLNSLFSQTSSKKSKSKSTASTQSMKDEDESPSGWRRKRRSSISLFRSGNSNTTSVSDTKSANYLRTPTPYHIPQAPTKSSTTTTYKDLMRYHVDHHKPACEITKLPTNEIHRKNENSMMKSEFSEKERSCGNGVLEKVRLCDVMKHDYHLQKYDPKVESREFRSFINDEKENDDDDDDDDGGGGGGDSDSSSDLFELTNCDLGYYSSGLPVFETTHMDIIKRGAPISS